MSQNTETPAPISEDLFTTQDLIEEAPTTENSTDEVQNVEMSEDLDIGSNTKHVDYPEHLHETEGLPESEEQELEQMEDAEEAEEEELNVMQGDTEESENNPDVANTEMSTDGGKVKAAKKPSTRISELPLSKVKHIIKLDPEVQLVNGEAVYLVTRATELFVKSLAKESFSFATQMKKKTITKSHVDQALAMLPIEL